MKLKMWIEQSMMTQYQASIRFGVSPNYLSELLSGIKHPSHVVAGRISAETCGAVTIQELLYPDGIPAGAMMAPTERA